VSGFARTLVVSSFSRVTAALLLCSVALSAHDGPPFPILSDHVSGPYTISIWTDPDATEDGTAGGQFWVAIDADRNDAPLPAETRVRIAIRPLDRPATELNAAANPVRGDATNHFAALVMDHEGPFGVRVMVDGPLGPAAAEATVEATYELRPPAYMIVWYLVPFVAVAALWARLLLARMRSRRRASANVHP
jgi:hypothetical protein